MSKFSDTVSPPATLAFDVASNGAEAVTSPTRRKLIAAGATACGAAALLAATPAHADLLDALKHFLYLDPIVLNFAFEAEELQCDFFTRVIRSEIYPQMDTRERSALNLIALQDRAHFDALNMLRDKQGAKGGTRFETMNASASRRPRVYTFPPKAFSSHAAMLSQAVDIKQNVTWAYHGAVDLIRDPKVLAPAGAIAGVEGRHLVVLREMSGLDPVPTPFEGQVSPQIIGQRLAQYGFRGGGMTRGQ